MSTPPEPSNQPPPPSATPGNGEQHKESNKLAVELTKQFLTLAVGGIGFVIGLLSTDGNLLPKPVSIIALVGFAISTGAGFLYFMRTVWEIRQHNSYCIFNADLQSLARWQLYTFFAVVVLVGVFAVVRKGSSTQATLAQQSTNTMLEIHNGTNIIREPIFEKSKVTIVISNGNLSLGVTP
jgi:hypothetical protein